MFLIIHWSLGQNIKNTKKLKWVTKIQNSQCMMSIELFMELMEKLVGYSSGPKGRDYVFNGKYGIVQTSV